MNLSVKYEKPEIQAFMMNGAICSASNPGAETSVENYSEQTYNWV